MDLSRMEIHSGDLLGTGISDARSLLGCGSPPNPTSQVSSSNFIHYRVYEGDDYFIMKPFILH